MPLQLIPVRWLEQVCRIIATGDLRLIQRTKDFSKEFQKGFPNDSEGEVEDAFLDFLESENPVGCPVTMDYPTGDTWEFFFLFKGRKTYGKIMLREGGRKVLLFSAHPPEKKRLRCEL